jgi:hypothetical protein
LLSFELFALSPPGSTLPPALGDHLKKFFSSLEDLASWLKLMLYPSPLTPDLSAGDALLSSG